MTQYNDVLNELQYYILNEDNIKRYLSQKIKTNKNMNDVNTFVKQKVLHNNNNCIFFPKEKDSLFWCFFILKNGITKYHLLKQRTILVERELKIDIVAQIKCTYPKLKLPLDLEKQMVFDSQISIQTFIFLCACEKKHVLVSLGSKQFSSLDLDYESSTTYVKFYPREKKFGILLL